MNSFQTLYVGQFYSSTYDMTGVRRQMTISVLILDAIKCGMFVHRLSFQHKRGMNKEQTFSFTFTIVNLSNKKSVNAQGKHVRMKKLIILTTAVLLSALNAKFVQCQVSHNSTLLSRNNESFHSARSSRTEAIIPVHPATHYLLGTVARKCEFYFH